MQAVFSKSECSPSKGAFLVSFTVSNPVSGAQAELKGVIDTGFDGFLMVDAETYNKLGLGLIEVPEEVFPLYRTLSGTTIFRRSRGTVRLAGKELEVEVVTPLHGAGKNLVGRRVLQKFTVLLHRGELACVGDAQIRK